MPIGDYEKIVKGVFKVLNTSDVVHPDNVELLRSYRRDKERNGMSAVIQQLNLWYLEVVAEHLEDTRFEDADTGDVKDPIK